jgi:ADP-ribosylglycohydrolase
VAGAGLRGLVLGDALGVPWIGVAPRQITRRRLLDDVGATGDVTRVAVAAEARADGAPPSDAPSPSGALALPAAFVLGLHHADARERREATLPLGLGAVVVADLAAWALEGRAIYQHVTDHANKWGPPYRGVALTQRSVIDSLLATLARHDDPTEGMLSAVRLGGEGIAVLTALVGGVLGAKRPTALNRVPWRERVPPP